MAKDPTAAAQRWANNLGASGQKISEGVDNVTVAPGVAAAKQKAVYVANVTARADEWARRVGAVPLSEWQAAMKGRGVQRIAQGAQDALPKMVAHLSAFLPHVEAGRRSLPPRGNLEQNLQRMVQMARHNSNFRGGAARV